VIAEQDGFKIGSDKAVEELTFVQLSGGRNPAKVIPFKNDIQELMAKTYTGLQTRITAFDRAETPYLSRPTPMFINRAGDYDHLARVKEWSSGSGDDS
jgi:ATP-dependent helicase/nuclease subunit B